MPTLSVFMPNYNHGKYLRDSLGAILGQSRRPDEVLILDDASTDDSWEFLQAAAARDPIVRVARNPENRGVMFGINWGLAQVQGDYVHFAAADDRVLPGFYQETMALLERHPQAGQCFSYPSLMDAEGRVQEMREGFHWSDQPRYFAPTELAKILDGRHVCGHCIVIRRQALLEAGGFPAELRWHSDWFAEMVTAFRHGICYIPRTFALQRMMAGTYSEKGRNHWPSQREALLGIFRRLRSEEYRDVLSLFQSGHAMMHQGPDAVRALLSSPEDWDLDSFKLVRVSLAQVLLNDEALARFFPAEELRDVQRRLRGEPAGAPKNGPRDAFLFEPDWSATDWVKVLMAYLFAFLPGDPVALVLPLDPGRPGQVTAEQVREYLRELIVQLGLQAFPDIVLVDDLTDLPATLGGFDRIQWVPAGSGPWDFEGPSGQRFAHAYEQLPQEGAEATLPDP